jgi:hypothetical protein
MAVPHEADTVIFVVVFKNGAVLTVTEGRVSRNFGGDWCRGEENTARKGIHHRLFL